MICIDIPHILHRVLNINGHAHGGIAQKWTPDNSPLAIGGKKGRILVSLSSDVSMMGDNNAQKE